MKITPLARKIASEAGIDLTEVRGSGVRGRILKEDIYRAVSTKRTLEQDKPAIDTLALVSGTANATEFLSVLDAFQPLWSSRFNQMLKKRDLLAYIVACALLDSDDLLKLKRNAHTDRFVPLNLAVFDETQNNYQVYAISKTESISLSDMKRLRKQEPGMTFDASIVGNSFLMTDLTESRVDWFVPQFDNPFIFSIGFAGISPRPFGCNAKVCLLDTLPVILRFDSKTVDYLSAAKFLTRVIELLEQPFRLLNIEKLSL